MIINAVSLEELDVVPFANSDADRVLPDHDNCAM